jgi:dolichyl-diphosphooligosaccharide--protein glycosyltransferase
MTLTVLFFLRSIDSSKSRRELVFYSILAGASLSYILASWGAARYVVGLLSLYIISTLVTQHYDRRHLISYTVMMFVGYSVAVFIPRLGFEYLYSMENMLVLMLILLLIVYDFAKDKLEIQNTTLLLVGLILILIIGIFALEAIGIINPISGKFLRVINPGATAENPLSESVAEHRRAAWTSFFRSFGVTLPLAVLGGYLFIRELNSRNLFLTLFLATAFYFAGSMSRLSLILSIPTALMASYGLIKIVEPFIQLSRSRDVVRERGRRRRRIPLGISRELAIVFVLFVIVSIFPSVWSTADASLRPTSLASSGISAIIGGNYPQDWLQALVFMKDNLPDDAVVVSWWDYGYWIEAIADRATMADGATINKTHIGYIGRIMMLNHTESLPMLEAYGGTHVVVFNTFNPGDQTQAWPFGDNVKWSWMVQIGGLNISDYINQDNPSNDLGQTEKGRASVLYGLMNLQPTPGFELIFVSDFRFVLVYEIRYGEI